MSEKMTEERFEALVAAYGADPMRWPAEERVSAQELAATGSTRVQAALAQAEDLDALLMRATVPDLSSAAKAAMEREAAPRLTQRIRLMIAWEGSLWQPAGALAAALFLGITLGAANPNTAASLADLTGSQTAPLEASESLDSAEDDIL